MYKYNDDTLIHSSGADFSVVDSIMRNGIMSSKYGKEHGVDVNKNYYGSNLEDTISCIRCLYVNEDVEDSAYNRYVPNGVSFIIEDVPFIYDKEERIIHRSDEVLVKDFIPSNRIKGIMIPEKLINTDLEDLTYIREDASSYSLIKHKVDNIKSYIERISDVKCDYEDWLNELYYLSEDAKNESDMNVDERIEEYKDTISDLNYEIGINYHNCFSKLIGKDNINIFDVVNYINKNTLDLSVYVIKTKNKNREHSY